MSRFSHYGSGQRLAFAMLCVGFGLCIVGAVVPYWMKCEVKMSDITSGLLGDEIPIVGSLIDTLTKNVDLVKVNMGVWVLCMEFVGTDTKCYSMYDEKQQLEENDYDDNNGGTAWIQLVRIAIALNIKLSLLCGLAACCRCMCCRGGRTIVHGIFAFLAGGCGGIAVAIMASHKNDLLLNLPFFEMDYDWGFYIYALGSAVLFMSSLFLCFSVPKEMPGGTVFMPGGAPYVSVTNTNVSQNVVQAPVNQYELNGQIRSFEPIPNQSNIQQPPPPY